MGIEKLFENNKQWVEQVLSSDPNFFKNLTNQQYPKYLWIGCSDSRVPANQITGLAPGEIFVHRNIANLVIHTDLNALSVIQFAVDILKVEHIIVCGHYGCSGVLAALHNTRLGIVDVWLKHLRDVVDKHDNYLGSIQNTIKHNTLCELNVIEQTNNVASTNIIQDAWNYGQNISLHGLLYGVKDGLLRNVGIEANNTKTMREQYNQCIQNLYQRKN